MRPVCFELVKNSKLTLILLMTEHTESIPARVNIDGNHAKGGVQTLDIIQTEISNCSLKMHFMRWAEDRFDSKNSKYENAKRPADDARKVENHLISFE